MTTPLKIRTSVPGVPETAAPGVASGAVGIRRFRGRPAAVALCVAALLVGLSTGCSSSSEGTKTECSLSGCVITFDRGFGDLSTSVLGMDVELVSATDTQATLSVAGARVTLPVDVSREVGGFTVRVRSITADQVVVEVSP